MIISEKMRPVGYSAQSVRTEARKVRGRKLEYLSFVLNECEVRRASWHHDMT